MESHVGGDRPSVRHSPAKQSNLRFIATCVPGAEAWLGRELAELRVMTQAVEGGVEGRASLESIRYLVAQSRLAESVRVRATRPFVARNFQELNAGLRRVPWHAYLVPRLPLDVRVVCKRSKLFHSDAVAQRVREAVTVRGTGPFPYTDDLSVKAHCNRVHVRLLRDNVQVSFDAAGEALHRRGYRRFVGEAPLRETLAALLLRIAHEACHGRSFARVWDPCAGSGTIPLEWLATRMGIHSRSSFLIDEWPCVARAAAAHPVSDAPGAVDLSSAFNRVDDGHDSLTPPLVTLSDVSEAAIRAAEQNAQELGVDALCCFRVGEVLDVESLVPDGTAVVTNLPYGVRLGSQPQALRLLHRLDSLLTRRQDLRPAVLLWGGGVLPTSLQASFGQLLRFRNGGRAVTVLVKR